MVGQIYERQKPKHKPVQPSAEIPTDQGMESRPVKDKEPHSAVHEKEPHSAVHEKEPHSAVQEKESHPVKEKEPHFVKTKVLFYVGIIDFVMPMYIMKYLEVIVLYPFNGVSLVCDFAFIWSIL